MSRHPPAPDRPERPLVADAIEYGLLIATIILVVMIGINALGHLIEPWFAQFAGRMTAIGT